MKKNDREEYERHATIVTKRNKMGKATFGDRGLLKFYRKKLGEAD